jgi:mannose-6-phosphate isomerase
MLRIDCDVQSYAWGKVGNDSEVGKLKQSADKNFVLEDKPYAELWMGTHPSGPSKLDEPDFEPLLDWLQANPSAVGTVPKGYPNDNLPFLFKVLSIKTALSIQAHPDKKLAVKLHKEFSDIYKDSNHKPEMCIALTRFEAMCGFRSLSETVQNCKEFPELALKSLATTSTDGTTDGTTDDAAVNEKETIRRLFKEFMSWTPAFANAQIDLLVNRLESERIDSPDIFEANPLKELMLRLNQQYPNDKGIFCPLILNYIVLEADDCFFMAANEPHAYLSGDCVECMALSDNVVRAGLTPKFQDMDTLCSMLTYNSGPVQHLEPIQTDDCTSLYRPPSTVCAEFEVSRIVIPASSSHRLLVVDRGSLLLVTSGRGEAIAVEDDSSTVFSKRSTGENRGLGRSLVPGSVLFQGADTDVSIVTPADSDIILYRAHCNLGPSGSTHSTPLPSPEKGTSPTTSVFTFLPTASALF